MFICIYIYIYIYICTYMYMYVCHYYVSHMVLQYASYICINVYYTVVYMYMYIYILTYYMYVWGCSYTLIMCIVYMFIHKRVYICAGIELKWLLCHTCLLACCACRAGYPASPLHCFLIGKGPPTEGPGGGRPHHDGHRRRHVARDRSQRVPGGR